MLSSPLALAVVLLLAETDEKTDKILTIKGRHTHAMGSVLAGLPRAFLFCHVSARRVRDAQRGRAEHAPKESTVLRCLKMMNKI